MEVERALDQLRAAAAANAVRGSLIFHLDLATELVRAELAFAGVESFELVTLVDADGYQVLALNDLAAPDLVAEGRFAPDGRPLVRSASGLPPRPAPAMASARRTVAAAFPGHAIVVIPPAGDTRGDGALEAYALLRASRAGDLVLGVHHHVICTRDGKEIVSGTPLSRTALVLPGRPDLPPTDLEVTHFGAIPSEIHTYLALKHGVDLIVATLESKLTWRVEGERVEPLQVQ